MTVHLQLCDEIYFKRISNLFNLLILKKRIVDFKKWFWCRNVLPLLVKCLKFKTLGQIHSHSAYFSFVKGEVAV